jgi:hypothetical protein
MGKTIHAAKLPNVLAGWFFLTQNFDKNGGKLTCLELFG